jgi:hypothetical protein
VRATSLAVPRAHSGHRGARVTEGELQILGSRCAAPGPLGVAWPLVVPWRALMRETPRLADDFFFSPHERGRLPALAGTRAADGTITERHNHQAAGLGLSLRGQGW